MPKYSESLRKKTQIWDEIERAVADYGFSVADLFEKYKAATLSPVGIVMREIDAVKEELVEKYGEAEGGAKIQRIFAVAEHPFYANRDDETASQSLKKLDADFDEKLLRTIVNIGIIDKMEITKIFYLSSLSQCLKRISKIKNS